jgi:hypothetical protein
VVEVAEGFVAEGGGAATVLIGEEVVAGGCGNGCHGWGPSPGVLLNVGVEGIGFGRFRVKSEGPAGAGLWVDLGLLLL